MVNSPWFPTNLAGLSPDEQNDALKTAAEYFAERYEADQKNLVAKGGLTFPKERSRESRLKSYYTETVHQFSPMLPSGMCILCGLPISQPFHVLQPPDDLSLILDEDYLEKRRMGMAPPLVAEALMDQAAQQLAEWQQAAEAAMMLGQPAPPKPQEVRLPKLWPMLLPSDLSKGVTVFNDYFFKYHQRDFINLLNDRVRGEEKATPVGGGYA